MQEHAWSQAQASKKKDAGDGTIEWANGRAALQGPDDDRHHPTSIQAVACNAGTYGVVQAILRMRHCRFWDSTDGGGGR
jgi:hypothetical protein